MVTALRRLTSKDESDDDAIEEPVSLGEVLTEVLRRHGLTLAEERTARLRLGETSQTSASRQSLAVLAWNYLPMP